MSTDDIQNEFELTGNKILDTLRQVFKQKNFRGKQQEAIESVLNGHNTLLVMPTGYGKTVCYAVPAVLENKVAVVVFPLLVLMLDQAERLRRLSMNVCYLMNDMEENEKENIIHKLNCNLPDYNFFFLTPETVLTPAALTILENISSKDLLGLIVIHEAYCIDTWGFYFRPSYAELWKLCKFGSPILAMTGTATARTQSVILNSLQLSNKAVVIKQTPNRENLIYHVMEEKSNDFDSIIDLIKQNVSVECGIAYCTERKDTIDVVYHLRRAGINAVFFHADMDVHAKQASVDSWKSGQAHAICATVAFDMGIDKSNVRFVIHHSMSKDLESYVQESGRAGRDGNCAHCYILFRFEDRTKHLRNICCLPESDRKHVALEGLNNIVKYCMTPVCLKKQIVTYFDIDGCSSSICNKHCDVCIFNKNAEPVDCSEIAREVINCLEEMETIQPKITAKVLGLTHRGS